MTNSSNSYPCPVIVLTLRDCEVLGFDNHDQVRNAWLSAVVQSEAQNVVIDLGHIKYLQSAGFRPLLSLRRFIKEQRNGKVILCRLERDVEEILRMTKMIGHDGVISPFEHQVDVPSAVASLYPS